MFRNGSKVVACLFVFVGLCFIVLYLGSSLPIEERGVDVRYGGRYVHATAEDILEFNPQKIVFSASKKTLSLIYDPLINISDKMGLLPGICASWEFDKSSFRCHLKQGVTFHNGKEMTSEDVVFSINYWAENGALDRQDLVNILGIQDYWNGKRSHISGVNAVGKYDILVELKTSPKVFATTLANPRFVVLPNNLNGLSKEEFFKKPVGTGPFVFVEKSDGEFNVKAFKNYHNGRPYLDGVCFKYFSNSKEAISRFENKEVHDLYGFDNIKKLIESGKYVPHIYQTSYYSTMVFPNNSKFPFSKLSARRLLFSFFDRKEIIEKCYPYAKEANGVIPFGIAGNRYFMKDDEGSKEFDIEFYKSKLLEEVDTIPEINIYHSPDIPNECTVALVNSKFKQYEIPWKMVQVSYDDFAKLFFSGKILAEVESLLVKNEDAYSILKYFDSRSEENLARIDDEYIDSLLDASKEVADLNERTLLYSKIDKRLADENYVFPVLYPARLGVASKSVKGLEDRVAKGYMIDFTKIWLSEENNAKD